MNKRRLFLAGAWLVVAIYGGYLALTQRHHYQFGLLAVAVGFCLANLAFAFRK